MKNHLTASLIGLLFLLTFFTFLNHQFTERVVYPQELQYIPTKDRIIDYQRYNCDSIKRYKSTTQF